MHEKYSLNSVVQIPSHKDDPITVLPTQSHIELKIFIPMDQIQHKAYYQLLRQNLRKTALSTMSNKTYLKEQEIQETQKVSLFESFIFKKPLEWTKKLVINPLSKFVNPLVDKYITPIQDAIMSNEISRGFFEASKTAITMALKTQIIEEKKVASVQNKITQKKIHFTDIVIPDWIRLSCAYFGTSIQTLACVLSSFSTQVDPSNTQEIWTISLVEYAFSDSDEENLDSMENLSQQESESQDMEVFTQENSDSLIDKYLSSFSHKNQEDDARQETFSLQNIYRSSVSAFEGNWDFFEDTLEYEAYNVLQKGMQSFSDLVSFYG